MIYQEFYSELGKLLYAIADIDGIISKKEKEKLKELIRKELVPVENHKDEFGTDAAFYAEFEFDIQEDSVPDTAAAFESFIDFIEEHKKVLDENLIWATQRVAEKLAEAYHQTNKKERKLLEVLSKKLDSLLAEKTRVMH